MSEIGRALRLRSQDAITRAWPENVEHVECDPQRDARAAAVVILRTLADAAPFPRKWKPAQLRDLADELETDPVDSDFL